MSACWCLPCVYTPQLVCYTCLEMILQNSETISTNAALKCMKQSPEKPRNIAFILRKVELYRQGLLCFQKNSSATLEKAIFFKKEAF